MFLLQEKAEEQRRQQQLEAARRLQEQQQLADMKLPETARWGAANNSTNVNTSAATLAQIQAAEAKEQELMREVRIVDIESISVCIN